MPEYIYRPPLVLDVPLLSRTIEAVEANLKQEGFELNSEDKGWLIGMLYERFKRRNETVSYPTVELYSRFFTKTAVFEQE